MVPLDLKVENSGLFGLLREPAVRPPLRGVRGLGTRTSSSRQREVVTSVVFGFDSPHLALKVCYRVGVCLGITNLRELVSRVIPCTGFEEIDDRGGSSSRQFSKARKFFFTERYGGFLTPGTSYPTSGG